MFKIYLFCESDTIHPLDVFNNIIMDSSLFNIMKDPDFFVASRFISEDEFDGTIFNIVNSVINSSNVPLSGGKRKNNKVVGGAGADDINNMEDQLTPICDFFSNPIPADFETNIIGYYELANQISNTILQLDRATDSDVTTKKLLTQLSKKIQPMKKMLDTAVTRSSNPRGRDTQKKIAISSTFSALSNFFSTIYTDVKAYNKKVTTTNDRISKLEESGFLTDSELAPVQKICKSVAYGVLTYILGAEEPVIGRPNWLIPSFGNHTLLTSQAEIIARVYFGKALSTIDENLFTAFRAYLDQNRTSIIKPGNGVGIYDYYNTYNPTNISSSIRQAIGNHWTGNSGRSIIDNATSEDILKIIDSTDQNGNINQRMRSTNVICPPSSRADAMGSFGSCGNAPTEIGNMDFSLTNPDQTMGYVGKMNYDAGLKKLQVNYYAKFGEFILPYVEINMRVSSINHGTLSANTTFVAVINKIILLWKKMFYQGVPNATTTDLFWESMKASNVFHDLVVVGSNKSVGDFFQEITSVARNGGYTNAFNVSQEFRVGAMGDTPSGTRAAFIIATADKTNIQNSTLAGYFSPTEGTFVGYTRPGLRGGKRKTHKKRHAHRKRSKTNKVRKTKETKVSL